MRKGEISQNNVTFLVVMLKILIRSENFHKKKKKK